MARRRDAVAAPPTTSSQWTRGWFARHTGTVDLYPSFIDVGEIRRQIDLAHLVADIFDRMPDTQVEALEAYHMTDLSLAEAADLLGITKQALHQRVRRATARFVAEWDGVTHGHTLDGRDRE